MGGVGPPVGRGSVSRQKPKALSTDAAPAGGPARSSCETPARWGGGGAKEPAHQDCGIDQPGRCSWEEARKHAKAGRRQAVRHPQTAVWEAYRKVAANKGAPGVDEVDPGRVRDRSEEQSVQDLEPDELGVVLSASGAGGGDTEAARSRDGLLGVPTVADRVAQTVVAAIWRSGRNRGSTPILMATGLGR